MSNSRSLDSYTEAAANGIEESSSNVDKHTLFVRKLPFATTNEELQEFFSIFGPLRSCFVVSSSKKETLNPLVNDDDNGRGGDSCEAANNDQEKKNQNLGFGFVNFVQQDDAQKAIDQIGKTKFKGWKLKVEFAIKKSIVKSNPPLAKIPPKKSDLSSSTTTTTTKKKRTKPQPLGKDQAKTWKVVVGNLIHQPEIDKKMLFKKMKKFGNVLSLEYPFQPHKALVEYASKAEAENAVSKLNSHIFKGIEIVAELQRHDKAHKLIIRNLPFSLTPEQLQAKLSTYGSVKECLMPVKPEDGKRRGFAIVQFEQRESAVKCLESMNATRLHKRQVAVDWCLPKDEYKKLESAEMKGEVDGTESENENDNENEDEIAINEEDSETLNENYNTTDSESEDSQKSLPKTSLSDDEDFFNFSNCSESDSTQSENEEENDEDQDDEDQEVEKEKSSKPLQKSPRKKQNFSNYTCFIRNLPFDATEEQLIENFSQFGDIAYAKIVQDKETGISKGTAFVNFKSEEAYNSCLEKCMIPELTSTSSLIVDDSKGISILGRTLHVFPAVNRQTAEKLPDLKAQQEEERSKDRRNLFLLQEGYIARNSKEAIEGEFSEKDLALREASFRERQTKLKNPKFFISKTRISLRNLPLSLDEKALKAILLQANCRPFHLKQVKIVRSKERKDSNGNFRSCGFGFVEFNGHKIALSTLRFLNQNSSQLFGKSRRPIVEFAVENSAILKKRQEKISNPSTNAERKASKEISVSKLNQKTSSSSSLKDKNNKRKPRPIGFNMPNKKRALLAKELASSSKDRAIPVQQKRKGHSNAKENSKGKRFRKK